MKKIYTIIIVILMVSFLMPFSGKKRIGENIKVEAVRSNDKIVIDGNLNEQIWKTDPVDNFTQKDPVEGSLSSEKTNVWIAYDDEAIYIAAKCFDSHPNEVIGLLSRRDNYNESDWFVIYIDSYNDKRSGYYFGVNAASSIVDGVLFNDGWDDGSWNGVWDYSAKLVDDGWNVEIRIPFTQIRFKESADMKWGINFSRKIQRKKEEAYFIMVPKKESGFVSHFATLDGLKGIKPKQRFEVLPYFVQKAQYLVHDAEDPFYKSRQYLESFGADFKVSLGSNLNLDATINPDFGQVEVDPAVVNLSAFETYYDEKRPFFIEGNNMFQFGYGGSNSNWGFNWGNPEIFYSRRIGRAPQGTGEIDDDGYINTPDETRILGAAKISGKINESLSIGFINATTERNYANVYNTGQNIEVEPLTNYSVLRTQKEFEEGKYGLGIIGTSVIRDLRNDRLKNILSNKAFVYGADGWITLDEEGTYVVNGYFSGSYVEGSKEYLVKMQRSPLRSLQRPDAKYQRIDSLLTSMSGYVGRIAINKQKGNFYLNSAIGVSTPGYEANDLGFQWRADIVNTHLVIGYRWYDPDSLFRSKSIQLGGFRNQDFDGNMTDAGIMMFGNFQFVNYYGVNFQVGYNPETYNNRFTRGGPIAKRPDNYFGNINLSSDSRKKVIISVFSEAGANRIGSKWLYSSLDLNWNPSSIINFSFGPFVEINNEKQQWVTMIEGDLTATSTYNSRYVFAELTQKSIGGNIRLNWTFTPTLSLQLFIQPLFSVGNYDHYKELTKPRSYDMNEYGKDGSTISYNEADNVYQVNPNANSSFSFDNPDFNFKSIRGNLILRWEFLPGSTFYLVWAHDKVNTDNPGDFNFGRDFRNIWRAESNNIFLAKVSYWFNL
ncbi:MAG: DUF5916 domain-containing protein [Syntrophothermus sp.]